MFEISRYRKLTHCGSNTSSKADFRLVGCFGFNGRLIQYFSLYRAVSQREGERVERIDESKNVQTTPTRTYCKRNRPLPYYNQNCRTERADSKMNISFRIQGPVVQSIVILTSPLRGQLVKCITTLQPNTLIVLLKI